MYVQLICKIKTSYLENCRISYPYNIWIPHTQYYKKKSNSWYFSHNYKNQNPSNLRIPDIFTTDLQNRRSYPYKRGTFLATARPSFNDIKNINDIKYSMILIFILRKSRLKLFQSNFQSPKLYTNILL